MTIREVAEISYLKGKRGGVLIYLDMSRHGGKTIVAVAASPMQCLKPIGHRHSRNPPMPSLDMTINHETHISSVVFIACNNHYHSREFISFGCVRSKNPMTLIRYTELIDCAVSIVPCRGPIYPQVLDSYESSCRFGSCPGLVTNGALGCSGCRAGLLVAAMLATTAMISVCLWRSSRNPCV